MAQIGQIEFTGPAAVTEVAVVAGAAG